jgi:hypothetical protein
VVGSSETIVSGDDDVHGCIVVGMIRIEQAGG